MKSRLPTGLMIIALLNIAGCLSVINTVIKPGSYMVYAGHILHGTPFKLYYSALGAASLLIGIGLLRRRKWSYVSYLAFSVYAALIALTNILLTSKETIMNTGWKTVVNNPWTFYLFQVGVICIIGVLVVWLMHYRREFRKGSANPALPLGD